MFMKDTKQAVASCIECRKVFSFKGLPTHYYVSHTDEGKSKWQQTAEKCYDVIVSNGRKLSEKAQAKYELSPKTCPECNEVIAYAKRQNRFCSQTCSAKFNNKKAYGQRKYGPAKTNYLTNHQRRQQKNNIVGPYSPLCKSKCRVCEKLIISRYQKKYCDEHGEQYSHNGRAKYWFTFKLSEYPDLFDFELIRKYGMRSRDKSNIGGVVRDHKVSVADAIKNNYDPRYIKHPLNCELLLNGDNARKHAKSSITYDELVTLVDEYERKRLS